MRISAMRLFILTAVMMGLAACAAPANDAASEGDTPTTKAKPVNHNHNIEAKETLTEDDRVACEAAGGIVGRAGMINWEHCVTPYSDAGKVCSDNSECEGQCQSSLPFQGKGPVTGKCQVNTLPFGCYSQIKNGKATHMLCVD